ncbi:MAG: LacI family DNA-binding transcriptional regulator [Pseudomonadota bacterium]
MPESTKKTTIYDLAELAGTSAGTVSAVINGNWEKRRISRKLATKVLRLADEHGFALNMQARALSRERSGMIGMIVPMYDNRYFSSIAQGFEARARDAGYFPIVTCTRRDPDLELAAARAMLGYQVERLICTGTTDPDRLHDLCSHANVPTTNLDLPGTKATSIISDNFQGALDLTLALLDRFPGAEPDAVFIGGRDTDHNTRERIRGFKEAFARRGMPLDDARILPCGYAADKASSALREYAGAGGVVPELLFVNSTISLEGIISALEDITGPAAKKPTLGCFDWDPFAARISQDIIMVRQDVDRMLEALFDVIAHPADEGAGTVQLIEVPTILDDRAARFGT